MCALDGSYGLNYERLHGPSNRPSSGATFDREATSCHMTDAAREVDRLRSALAQGGHYFRMGGDRSGLMSRKIYPEVQSETCFLGNYSTGLDSAGAGRLDCLVSIENVKLPRI